MTPYTLALTLMLSLPAAAPWPTGHAVDGPDTQVVGELQYEHARRSDTLMDIARWQNMGYREIRRANPEVDIWKPGEGTRVLIPSLHVLPAGPRDGIVINRAEKRLYYYYDDPDSGLLKVRSHPIGIGRQGRATPASGQTRVVAKLDQPAWYPTEGVRADYASRGIPLASVIPPGPDNPLGEHALVLEMAGYLIHGTNRPDGVGMRVSQGCVRLYPEHIRQLVAEVQLGTPVHFIDQPVKLGQRDGRLYLEVHADAYGEAPDLQAVETEIAAWLENNPGRLGYPISQDRLIRIAAAADGVASEITTGDSAEGSTRTR